MLHTFSKWIPVYKQETKGERFRVKCSKGYFEPTKAGAEDLKIKILASVDNVPKKWCCSVSHSCTAAVADDNLIA